MKYIKSIYIKIFSIVILLFSLLFIYIGKFSIDPIINELVNIFKYNDLNTKESNKSTGLPKYSIVEENKQIDVKREEKLDIKEKNGNTNNYNEDYEEFNKEVDSLKEEIVKEKEFEKSNEELKILNKNDIDKVNLAKKKANIIVLNELKALAVKKEDLSFKVITNIKNNTIKLKKENFDEEVLQEIEDRKLLSLNSTINENKKLIEKIDLLLKDDFSENDVNEIRKQTKNMVSDDVCNGIIDAMDNIHLLEKDESNPSEKSDLIKINLIMNEEYTLENLKPKLEERIVQEKLNIENVTGIEKKIYIYELGKKEKLLSEVTNYLNNSLSNQINGDTTNSIILDDVVTEESKSKTDNNNNDDDNDINKK